MAELRWWQTSWKRIGAGLRRTMIGLLLLVALFLQVGAVLWMASPGLAHVAAWDNARQMIAIEGPTVNLTPQPLPDVRDATLDGIQISRYGYTFQVPWSRVKFSRDFHSVTIFSFDAGSSVMVFDPADHMDMLGVGWTIDEPAREELRQLLGDAAVRSHYGYANVEMGYQPHEVSLFHSTEANVRAMTLSMTKSMDIPEGTTAIYNVATPHLRGFQIGDPRTSRKGIQLLLFDDHDHPLKLVLKGPRDSTRPVLTQDQINAIVASIRPPE